ncbi:BIR protein [Plasmodium berghei]|uniref:BIR protein n=2 Tax=Plasmodium berghei TaxID=5821 RepID=A0A509AI84_PLABA|nr:BIR protein [Plasmodium berghei ANKA]SBW38357.1 BIR protein [Plasmodium berghei]SCL87360.1 BIR protein [Plasmodium berghei]VUC54931.1 BIR protein [Plasmodium berghei ANKA]|eukprot:XP_034420751.1 BIR protein [Plasmodium berghei ANKA]
MNDHVCRRFLFVRSWFPDKLDKNKNYQFLKDEYFNKYCSNQKCDSDLEKINAVCLTLFNELFGKSSLFSKHNNVNIVDYIIIWLSYMLNLKNNDGSNNLEYFNKTYINNDENYKKPITDVTEYGSYKDLINNKKEFMDISSEKMSKLYILFKILCNMYTDFDENTSYCAGCSENADKFVAKYYELNNDSSITSNSSYNDLLSTLSNDYNNFKNYCNSKGDKCKDYPDLLTIEKIKTSAQGYKQISEQLYTHGSNQISEQLPTQGSEITSSSSIGNKLFTVLSIFGAIAFFLGIGYKCSLFGFRKRAQKQYLRGKLNK